MVWHWNQCISGLYIKQLTSIKQLSAFNVIIARPRCEPSYMFAAKGLNSTPLIVRIAQLILFGNSHPPSSNPRDEALTRHLSETFQTYFARLLAKCNGEFDCLVRYVSQQTSGKPITVIMVAFPNTIIICFQQHLTITCSYKIAGANTRYKGFRWYIVLIALNITWHSFLN